MHKKAVCNYQRYLFDNGVDININIRSVMRLGVNKYERGPGKRTSQGKRKKCKKSSMNKSRKRSWKAYRGQGR